ncbi:hypothetical protein SAMN04487894_10479 [Niabella drilacis]|uniref:Uncharacterized protein n=1 Tax=Niabella drilacis (strain DSM 25811 / CCM 8410 / CCUG 62505 / LMG 26954 / E90) TaxID=1285928 RepID=A0A1G6PLS2_NIADE|nr:hypothetical protein SAMN04487894_10479 [Niabella drilacis]
MGSLFIFNMNHKEAALFKPVRKSYARIGKPPPGFLFKTYL